MNGHYPPPTRPYGTVIKQKKLRLPFTIQFLMELFILLYCMILCYVQIHFCYANIISQYTVKKDFSYIKNSVDISIYRNF